MKSNRHKILSIDFLSLLDEHIAILTTSPFDSSFRHLESLSIGTIKPNTVFSLLLTLSSLPYLFSLSIDSSHDLRELTEIYELVLRLPK